MSSGFTDQLNAKDAQISALNERLNGIETEHINELETARNEARLAAEAQVAAAALMEAEIASLKAANESLTENFNKFKSVLTSIDSLTDEVID